MLEVGQTVYVIPTGNLCRYYGGTVKKAIISKIGRKYFYVDIDGAYQVAKIDKKSMRGEGEMINSAWLVFTSMHEIEERKEKQELIQFLYRYFHDGMHKNLTLTKLKSIKAIIGELE
jgi:hypothetical protein